MGRNSSVGIATRYGLDVPGIESRWGGSSFSAPETQPASCAMDIPGILVVERPGRGVDDPPTPTSSAEVKERVELYLWALMACYRANFEGEGTN